MSVEKVLESVLDAIKQNQRICLPNIHLSGDQPSDYEGIIDDYHYLFEGEEDLLHLILMKQDKSEIGVDKAIIIARKVLCNVPPALIWMKPAQYSCHFYLGHDDLLRASANPLLF